MRLMTMAGIAVVCAVATTSAAAQSVPEVKLPPSPMGQAAVQVGGTWTKTDQGQRYEGGKWIVVDYGRPLLRGRKHIFGSGDEYGKAVSDGAPLWRAGANATTTLTTQVPLSIGGKTLAPGVYNLFVDLKEGHWTLVLSNQARQPKYDPRDKVDLYGSYNYDPKFDVVRVPLTMKASDVTVEQFTIGFVNATDRSVTMTMVWETTCATIELPIAR